MYHTASVHLVMERTFLLENRHMKNQRLLEAWLIMEILPWLIMALAFLLDAFGDPFEPLVVDAICEKIQSCR